jgi:hypothetical protein
MKMRQLGQMLLGKNKHVSTVTADAHPPIESKESNRLEIIYRNVTLTTFYQLYQEYTLQNSVRISCFLYPSYISSTQ